MPQTPILQAFEALLGYAGSRTRTGTRSPPVDFESTASAIPPRRRVVSNDKNYITTECNKRQEIFLNYINFSNYSKRCGFLFDVMAYVG